MCNRITGNRTVARNCNFGGGISRVDTLHAAGPIGQDGIMEVAEIDARDRFEKTSAEQNLLMRKPRHDVVARMTAAGKE